MFKKFYPAKKKKKNEILIIKQDELKEIVYSPHDEQQSSGPRPAKLCWDQYIFSELYKNKFKNFIWTSNIKFSFEDWVYMIENINLIFTL